MISKFKKAIENFNDITLTIAFAEIIFKFPKNTLYPCLSIKDPKYGLISPLEGRTVSTIAEIHLALYMGAEITYIEAFVVDSMEGLLFMSHIKLLIDKRDEAKRNNNKLLDQLYKLYINTLYGKVSQGINPKNSFDIRDSGTKELGKSTVTQPFIASMITGTLRAGLSALIVAINELNADGHDYLIISVTTDGMLYRVTSKSEIKFKDCLKDEFQSDIKESLNMGDKIFKHFKDVDPILYNKLQEFPVLRLIQNSRKMLGKDEFLEIKHSVNKVLNIKTRGQIGAYNEK